ncbi:MAG: hypothetical protein R3D51_08930 [Hyphomicrobiaceae bacterium]
MILLRNAFMTLGWLICVSTSAYAMGYDSLTCGELVERRDGYFAEFGFCTAGSSQSNSCKPASDGAQGLPEPQRTQVQMIEKVLTRKGCAEAHK